MLLPYLPKSKAEVGVLVGLLCSQIRSLLHISLVLRAAEEPEDLLSARCGVAPPLSRVQKSIARDGSAFRTKREAAPRLVVEEVTAEQLSCSSCSCTGLWGGGGESPQPEAQGQALKAGGASTGGWGQRKRWVRGDASWLSAVGGALVSDVVGFFYFKFISCSRLRPELTKLMLIVFSGTCI